jgi:peptidoglycan/LPS O-acetylase OafA/YrhL
LVIGVLRGGTFGDALRLHRGEGPGFAVLRLLLALAIFFIHARYLSHLGGSPDPAAPAPLGNEPQQDIGAWTAERPFFVVHVAAFFALSGFLVTGSALRVRYTSTFLAFRAFRIFPALLVEVTLSALLLGPLFTRLLLHEYFSNSQFFRYFGNIIGWITFYLPGVFETNRYNIVNANLWTLPSEFDCYFITALLMLTGAIYRRALCTAVLAIVTVIFVILNTFSNFAVTPFVYSGYTITYYFFVGMLFYHWKDRIPARWWLFAVSACMSYVFMYFQHSIFLAPIFVVYCVVFLGVVGIREIAWLRNRDYSYGLYLYGYPITQACLALFHSLRGHAVVTALIGLACSMSFAAFSWNVIEKPMLALKSHLPRRFFPKAERPPRISATATENLRGHQNFNP